MLVREILSWILVVVAFGSVDAQTQNRETIKLNQIGFYPEGNKIAVVASDKGGEFIVASEDLKIKYFTGKLSDIRKSTFSPVQTRLADFSNFKKPGRYVILVPGVGNSFAFDIKAHVHHELSEASLRFFYFQRFSIPLKEEHAGKWRRPSSASHKTVYVHPSAASGERKEGTVISSPRGWIDAGDYNKYIVNSGITTATLLSAYEDFPLYYDTLKLNIPESGNGIPDLLDEVLWNVRWMLTMQDVDGGVYHKCTNAKFDGMVMPDQANTPRYVVQKGTAASLNFAAVMAQSSRVFSTFDKVLPGLKDSCLQAATKAWEWAIKNPAVEYDQRKMNQEFDPDVTTGGYGDKDFRDEFLWAGSELFVSTKDERFLVRSGNANKMPIPSWNQVTLLSYYSLMRVEKEDNDSIVKIIKSVKERIVLKADSMVSQAAKQYYNTVMGSSPNDFIWGSNSVAANQSILLIQAYRITKKKIYLQAAQSNLDYILGRNATGYSYVTGFGDKLVMHPHHRPSEADGVIEPVPGMLVGGPNPGKQDKCHYPSSIPDEAYVDDVCSYASNEVAINWNAPLVYLVGAMEVYNH